MKVISTETREEAWLKAVNHLKNNAAHKTEYNLIIEVTQPALSNDRTRVIRTSFDKFLQLNNEFSVQTVADTIFPAALYKKHGAEGVYTIYPEEVYPKIKKIRANQRDTYAMRTVRGTNAKGQEMNPLKEVVSRLSKIANTKRGVRCAHEISLDDSESIPINQNDRSLYGFPCLSHLSFKLSHDRETLHLTAIYRSQFFIQKAMGNLLGLARLQDFVCREIGTKMGTLVCHATYAWLDDDKGKGAAFGTLLKSLED